jgi:hypothetical protein
VELKGIKVVRSNPDVWFWKGDSRANPLGRAIDTLLPLSGPLSFPLSQPSNYSSVALLPASRFFRPYSKRESVIQGLKIQRIKNEMLYAARNNQGYHLWWHPHNFGYFPSQNLSQLEQILQHFVSLRSQFGFESETMVDFYNNQSVKI